MVAAGGRAWRLRRANEYERCAQRTQFSTSTTPSSQTRNEEEPNPTAYL